MPKGRLRVTCVLSCLHTVTFVDSAKPKMGERLWCFKCSQYKEHIRATNNYSIRCDDCNRYRKKDYGDAFITADTYAVKHSLAYIGHTVYLLNHGQIVGTYQHDTQPELVDAPPF